jgi:hypothetical protein
MGDGRRACSQDTPQLHVSEVDVRVEKREKGERIDV